MAVSQTLLVFDDLDALKRPIKYSAGWPFIGICLMVFWWVHWGYEFWGGQSQRWSVIFFTWYQGDVLSTWFMAVHDGHDRLAKVPFVRFLYYKFTFLFFSLSMLCSLGRGYYVQPMLTEWWWLLGGGGYAPPPWRRGSYLNYLEFFCMENLSVRPHLFVYSVICISLGSWILILYFGLFYWEQYPRILFYWFCCSDCPWAFGSLVDPVCFWNVLTIEYFWLLLLVCLFVCLF